LRFLERAAVQFEGMVLRSGATRRLHPLGYRNHSPLYPENGGSRFRAHRSQRTVSHLRRQ